jgi:hypothetical protein
MVVATRPVTDSPDAARWCLEPPANTRLLKDPFATDDWRLDANLGTDSQDLAGD